MSDCCWDKDFIGVNAMVTIHNVGVLFSSGIHFGSATLSLGWPSYQGSLPFSFKKRATLAYVGVTGFIVLLTIATIQGFLPQFFTQGIGPTPLRQWVLGTAVVLFALSGIVFMILHFKTNSDILYWYSLALTLFALGFLCVFLIKTSGNPLTWIGRCTQYVGGLYLLVAVLATVRVSRTKEDKTGVAETSGGEK
jgi:peptidoglycan/LPS O-acetylase OafA/YrhL